MKKTPQYFECLRLRADINAYSFAHEHYQERLQTMDEDPSGERIEDFNYLIGYCAGKSEVFQLQAIEKLKFEPEWLKHKLYTPCEWNREQYGNCKDGMFTTKCKHNTEETSNK